jgi:DNA-binding winged helix-turn-helix (wHTH) protein
VRLRLSGRVTKLSHCRDGLSGTEWYTGQRSNAVFCDMVPKLLTEPRVDERAVSARLVALTFASFRLDLKGSRLLQGDRAIPLRPKTWAVLLYLAERPGVLVTKDQLLDTIWPDVAVTPDTINKSIGELRVALDDDSRTPRFIETVHRRGYRFIAPVNTVDATDEAGRAAVADAREPPRADSLLVWPVGGVPAE